MLEYTSDGFISQAISKISGYLKLTEAMAGATLLAFSNGATDVITALVAGSNDEGDDDLAVGALFGASTFAVCIILGVVIYATPEKNLYDLKRGNLVRDISTYLISIFTFILVGLGHTSYWIIGTILVLIYLVYVTLVWLEERKKDSSIDQQNQLRQTMRKTYAGGQPGHSGRQKLNSVLTAPEKFEENDNDQDELESNLTSNYDSSWQNSKAAALKQKQDTYVILNRLSTNPMDMHKNQLAVPLIKEHKEEDESDQEAKSPSKQKKLKGVESVISEGKVLDRDIMKLKKKRPVSKIYYKVKKEVHDEWKELGLFFKIIYVIEAPVKFFV